MKILLVSMPSLHFFRWTEQLKQAGYDVYWFDIVDGSPTNRLSWVKKHNGWKVKYPNLKGRYFVKQKLPFLYKLIRPILEEKPSKAFEEYLLKINPDVVQSFAMQISCVPIIKVMEKYPKIKWIYSSWGSDLFNLESVGTTEKQVKRIVNRVDYYFSDCKRDFKIIKQFGFTGKHLGTLPGGGGYDFNLLNRYIIKPASERHTILVKGYQGKLGRSIEVLKALKNLKTELKNFKIIVFSADEEVINFSKKYKLDTILNISLLSKEKFIPHLEIMKLMGEALIYVGNSISDGLPNTLIEAVVMGAFPIQSNPGRASEEIISHNQNGFLIQDPNNIKDIEQLINRSLVNSRLIEKAFIINQMELKANFDFNRIQSQVLSAYKKVEKNIF